MNRSWKKQFVTIYSGQAFSIVGSAAVQFAIIWYLTLQTGSAVTLTIATIIGYLPAMLLGPFAGFWIDRFNRRTVIMLADGFTAVASAILGAAFLMYDAPPVWFVYIILFMRGIGSVFHSPAIQSAIPMFVPEDSLTKSGGWVNLIHSVSNMLGPVLGAALIAFMNIGAIMLVDIIGAAIAIVCLLFVKIPNPAKTEVKVSFFSDLKQGLVAIKKNKPLVAILLPLMLCYVLYSPLSSLFPLLIKNHFNGTAWHVSILQFAFASGLLISSVILGLRKNPKRLFTSISAAIVVFGFACSIGGLLDSSGFIIFTLCGFIIGCMVTIINVPMNAYIQMSFPQEVMGKVFSMVLTLLTLCMPIGLLIAGPVSDTIGIAQWFLYSGAAVVLTGILCYLLTFKFDKRPLITNVDTALTESLDTILTSSSGSVPTPPLGATLTHSDGSEQLKDE